MDTNGIPRVRDLADNMGVTTGYVSRLWNQDEKDISLEAIEKVCKGLGIDPIEIDLYVEKMLPFLARRATSLTIFGRDLLREQGAQRKAKSRKTA